MKRRTVLNAAVAGATVAMAGCLGGDDSPDEAAEAFIIAIDELEPTEANALLHPDSPIDSPSNAFGRVIGSPPDTVTIEVLDADVEESDDRATVVLTVDVDLANLPAGAQPVEFDMRKLDDEWRVYEMSEPQ